MAFSFWAAYSTLMILGLRYPLKLLPLLLLQFFYKLVWLVVVAYPLWSASQLRGSSASGLATIFVIAVVCGSRRDTLVLCTKKLRDERRQRLAVAANKGTCAS